MVEADSAAVYPAAHWCNNLSINGFSDWYLPARDELELLWRNLKPNTASNVTTARPSVSGSSSFGEYTDLVTANGANRNSDANGAAYTTSAPAQTGATAFRTGGTEAFIASYHWSSSEEAGTKGWAMGLGLGTTAGAQFSNNKIQSSAFNLRAVRRSII